MVLTRNGSLNVPEQTLMRNPERAKSLLTPEAIASAPDDETKKKLQLLAKMLSEEPSPTDLLATNDDTIFLSDAIWEDATVGWGKVSRNRYWFNKGLWEGVLFQINNEVFEKGLYAHSNSSYKFSVGGKWKTFDATVGLRDGAFHVGSAIFTVVCDGREVFRSKLLRPGQKESFKVDISNVQSLE